MGAVEYIEMLESEVEDLKSQLEHRGRALGGRNELLEYLKSLQPQNLQASFYCWEILLQQSGF